MDFSKRTPLPKKGDTIIVLRNIVGLPILDAKGKVTKIDEDKYGERIWIKVKGCTPVFLRHGEYKTANGFYVLPREKWGATKCAKMAWRIVKDGLGAPYPFRGAYPVGPGCVFGVNVYNGGIVHSIPRGGERWFKGDIWLLPLLAKGYKWFYEPTWCWRMLIEDKQKKRD